MHDVFLDSCLFLTLAPPPRCIHGYARCFLGFLLVPYLGSTASVHSPSALIISWNDAGMFCSGKSCHLLASCLRKYTFLCLGAKPRSISRASFWLPLTVMAPKVAGTLRQRYAEGRAASKVFSRPCPNMALYGYSMSTTSKLCIQCGGSLGCQRKQAVLQLPRAQTFSTIVVERFRRFF
jgi:hypothetical protein